MNAIRLAILGAVLLFGVSVASADVDTPPAAQEIVKQFEEESAEIEKKVEPEIKKALEKTVVELKKLQDVFCKDAKLDEAVAVRDLIRSLQAGGNGAASSELPVAAREVLKQHEVVVGEIQKKAEADLVKRRDTAAVELKKLQDVFCKDAKLDEAVAVRDLIRLVREGVTTALPDPGYVNNQQTDIGKVLYYQVTGVITGGSIYGTDIFTTGSHLAMAAVHSGVLREGQKGIVKVTILPGQTNYPSTSRFGSTSSPWGSYNVSFKVERIYGFLGKPPVQP